MLSVDAVAVADGENPLSARPEAGEVAFVPCSLPRRGQFPPPVALLQVGLRPDIPQVQLP